MIRALFIGSIIAVINLTGCGGGGSGAATIEGDVTGIYSGQMFETRNTCPALLQAPDVITAQWKVNQAEKDLVLDASSGATYEGSITGSSSFRVLKVDRVTGGCITTTTVEIGEISADTGMAQFEVETLCPIGNCTVGYEGILERRKQ